MNTISITRTDGVALIGLDAVERRNALTPAMADDLVRVCEEVDGDPSVGAVVLYGEGGHFCSGAHRDVLTGAGEDPASAAAFDEIGRIYAAFRRVGTLGVPTIAAVQGSVVGAGVNLMMATDLRVVARDAKIMSGFLQISLHPGGGHFTLVNRTAGREATAAMALFGQAVDGQRAVEIGLAWMSLEAVEVVPKAMEMARQAARDPQLARASVASFRLATDAPAMSWDAALAAERAAQMWSLRRRAAANAVADRSGLSANVSHDDASNSPGR